MDGATFLKLYAPTVSNTLNTISITASLLALAIFSVLSFYKPSLMNRVTLRLQIGISIFDVLKHSFALFHHINDVSATFCALIGYTRTVGTMVYCFLNVAIALNLQLVFLHNLQPKRYWEIFYWVAALGLGFLVNVPPYVYDYFGKNGDGLCHFKADKPLSVVILNVNINGVMIFTCLYCLVVSGLVIFKFFKNVEALNQFTTLNSLNNDSVQPKIAKNLKKLIFRISLYPIVCFISLSGSIVRFFVTLTGGNKGAVGLILWSMLGLTTTGLFNFIAFCFDPTLHAAAYSAYSDFKAKSQIRSGLANDQNQAFDIELNQTNTESNDNNTSLDSKSNPYTFETSDLEDSKLLGDFVKLL